ncbi:MULTISPECIES: hypothetical protein [Hyphomonas]|jgi:predicted MFS family arabinose efflux permease|uniref:hypothetical protein n=1 Tax=Hyphomonas TaxID=85 RepID=UPI003512713C
MNDAAVTGENPVPDKRAVIMAILMGGLGVAQVVAMPLLAPLIANAFRVTEVDAGWVGLANLLGTAAGSLVVTVFLNRLSFRVASVAAALVACISQLSVAILPGFEEALMMEALAGAGAGVLLALSAAVVGASSNPDRGFALILTLQAVVAVAVLVVIPFLTGGESLWPVTGFMAGVQALLIPLGVGLGARFAGAVSASQTSLVAPVKAGLFMKAVAYFVFSAAVGVLWVFAAVLGQSAELEDTAIGQALAVGNVAAIIGSLLAAIVTSRLGRIGPVTAVCVLMFVSVALFSQDMSLGIFYVASCLFLFAWGGGLPLMMGAVAEVDITDRVTSLLPVLAFAGMGIGPALVSFSPGGQDLFQRVLLTTSFLVAIALALFCLAQVGRRFMLRH